MEFCKSNTTFLQEIVCTMWRRTGCKCAGRITNCHDGTIMFIMFNRAHHHEGEVRKAGLSVAQREILKPHMEGGRPKPAQALFILRENGNHDKLGKTTKNFKKVIKGYLYRDRKKKARSSPATSAPFWSGPACTSSST